jgi:hypothetical protein
MRQDRRRIVLTIPELQVVLALVIYGVGALAFALFGAMFFAWLVLLGFAASPFILFASRRRRSVQARLRAERRRARIATYSESWREWEEAA